MTSWGLCALPAAAGFAGGHSLCRISRVCVLSLHLKMSPREHSNLCEGSPQALGCADHPWLSAQCDAFSKDTNISPDVFFLALPVSKHLNVNAKAGWFCHLRSSGGIWVPEPCSTLESCLLFCFGSYHFRPALGT